MTKHTPTPWSYVYDGSSDWSIGEATDPQAKKVCGIWDKDDERGCNGDHDTLPLGICALHSWANEMRDLLQEAVENPINDKWRTRTKTLLERVNKYP